MCFVRNHCSGSVPCRSKCKVWFSFCGTFSVVSFHYYFVRLKKWNKRKGEKKTAVTQNVSFGLIPEGWWWEECIEDTLEGLQVLMITCLSLLWKAEHFIVHLNNAKGQWACLIHDGPESLQIHSHIYVFWQQTIKSTHTQTLLCACTHIYVFWQQTFKSTHTHTNTAMCTHTHIHTNMHAYTHMHVFLIFGEKVCENRFS